MAVVLCMRFSVLLLRCRMRLCPLLFCASFSSAHVHLQPPLRFCPVFSLAIIVSRRFPTYAGISTCRARHPITSGIPQESFRSAARPAAGPPVQHANILPHFHTPIYVYAFLCMCFCRSSVPDSGQVYVLMCMHLTVCVYCTDVIYHCVFMCICCCLYRICMSLLCPALSSWLSAIYTGFLAFSGLL